VIRQVSTLVSGSGGDDRRPRFQSSPWFTRGYQRHKRTLTERRALVLAAARSPNANTAGMIEAPADAVVRSGVPRGCLNAVGPGSSAPTVGAWMRVESHA
jgi:hypothetical protein